MCDIIISSKLFNFKKDISVNISKIELNEYNSKMSENIWNKFIFV